MRCYEMSKISKPTKLSDIKRRRECSARPCSERTQGESTVTCEMNLQRGGVGRTAHGRGRTDDGRLSAGAAASGRSTLESPFYVCPGRPATADAAAGGENAPLPPLQPLRLRFGCTARCSALTASSQRSHTVTPSPPEVRGCKVILQRFPS